MDDAEQAYWLTLFHLPNMSARLFDKLVEVFGSPAAALAADPAVLHSAGLSEALVGALRAWREHGGNSPLGQTVRHALEWGAAPGHRLLTLADVVVSTSSWEGQPLNLQEALRAGRPIVATDVGGTGEVTGAAALLVPYGDAEALADRIADVLTDTDLAARLAQQARQRAGELPSRADTLQQVQRCYRQVLWC